VGTTTTTVADLNLPVKVNLSGLQPGTEYFYRVVDAAGDQQAGRFVTAAPNGTRAGLSFGATGDWRGELAPYRAIANVAGQQLDFFVALGDTIYADVPSPAVTNPDGSPKPQATSLEDFRAKHQEVYSDRFGKNLWADVRASTALYATIDDHEVTNDFAGGQTLGTDARFTTAFPADNPAALINDSTLFENGLRVFQEYNPLRDEFYGNTGNDRTANERKLYRANRFGDDAATFLLDTRSFRDQPLVAADITDPLDVGRFLLQSATLDRPFLGQVQLNDLKQDLLSAQTSGVAWKFIIVPEPIQELGIYNADAFEGYARERTELLQFIETNGIKNVVFVAADIHGTFVNNLTYQLAPGGDRIATSAFEVTTGSVAYYPPFGPTVIEVASGLGLLSPQQRAVYDALPIAPDGDDLVNDKDDFLKSSFRSLAIDPAGYDPIGLNTNLPQADGLINATLLQGDYVAAHTYGWTQFDIDASSQKLTVTTYGIPPYSATDLASNPEAVLGLTPAIVSQFEVTPDLAGLG
jgi:phosphodiesterase/alkaline phosphatase D-like protein